MENRSVTSAIMITALTLFLASACFARDNDLYMIERDTLQTRNFTPIINHETMLVNRGETPLNMDLVSPVPSGKLVHSKYYPAFLEDSLLSDPLCSTIEIAPNKTSYLIKPEILEDSGGASFVWKGLTIPVGEAVIAQYDNYLGEPDMYWTKEGLDAFGLRLNTTYTTSTQGELIEFSFVYELVNNTGSDISELSIDSFIPLQRIIESGKKPFFNLKEIGFSPNTEVSQVTKVDGFGKAASGVAVIYWARNLEAGGKARFLLKLTGTDPAKEGSIWPIIGLQGRCIQKPVWPPTRITTTDKMSEERFSYVAYNLVIQDSRVIAFTPEGLQVTRAK
jgi:hypothetical protein